MYGYCDNYNGKIACVYGGYEVSHTYGDQGLSVSPLNCEHTVPQSFFNSASPMVSDIHHLFPAYDSWNSLRSNYPFYECNDAQTQVWIIGSTQTPTMPTTNIDGYSEYYNGSFEPRESHKGNLARAVAYFYTVYPTEAGQIFSTILPNTLCNWSNLDPVDAAEQSRNTKAATYQGNRNPFIDHPDWVTRAWCPQLLATDEHIQKGTDIQSIIPNPTNGFTQINLLATDNMPAEVCIVNTTGSILLTQNQRLLQGENQIELQLEHLPQGCYFVQIKTAKGVVTKTIVKMP
jgi:Endonuclease I/Secretion system C-terminal sorting domain